MQVCEGTSDNNNTVQAIDEATKHWAPTFSPDILFIFLSTAQCPHIAADTLSKRFPNTLIVGCTTAGEWTTKKHNNNSLVLAGIATPDIRWSMAIFDNDTPDYTHGAKQVSDALLQQLGVSWRRLNTDNFFCLSFFDGLSKQEEPTLAAMSAALGSIPILGGSAADDLQFKKTHIIANNKAYQNKAVFILAESKIPFRILKHQHFIRSNIDVVITKAEEKKRIVHRLDGMPAATRYAQLLGLEVNELTADVFSHNPLIYSFRNEHYIRTIRSALKDGSLEFFCAIEEGMLLNLCEHQNMVHAYESFITSLKQGEDKVVFLLLYNCVHRAIEGENNNANQWFAQKACQNAEHVIGFDTYGEQWQGLHMNQTLVALALGTS